jgi:hypothetical protein
MDALRQSVGKNQKTARAPHKRKARKTTRARKAA